MDARDVIKIIVVSIILLGDYMDPYSEIKLFVIRIKSQWVVKAFFSILAVFFINLLPILKNDKQNKEIINKINEYDPKKWTEKFPNIWELLKKFLTKFFDGIIKSVKKWAENVSKSFGLFFKKIEKWFSKLGSWFIKYFTDIVKNLKEIATGFTDKFYTWLIEFVVGIFMLVFTIIKDLGSAVLEFITVKVPSVIVDKVFSVIPSEIPGVTEIKDGLEDAMTALFKPGAKDIPGFDLPEELDILINGAKKAAEGAKKVGEDIGRGLESAGKGIASAFGG